MINKLTRYKVWLEIDEKAVAHNIKVFRQIIGEKIGLWSVVKSNAYGHGLVLFSKLAEEGVDGFCVDSVVEGLKLRREGIKKPILVLGPTLPPLYSIAKKFNITISISNIEGLKALTLAKNKPNFHLKIDTGMHRQGFYPEEINKIIRLLGNWKLKIGNSPKGIYSHFASAKDINYPSFNELQFSKLQIANSKLEGAGFKNLKKHISATAGTLINPKYHLDMIRIGIGLYGLWPSKELEIQLGDKIKLKPALAWFALISEIKKVKKGDYIGYDLTERIHKDGKIAIVPIGYWHGLPRSLSSIGEVWVKNQPARIMGRVSMDLIVIDILNINCKVGDEVEIKPMEIAQKTNSSHYEIITRINPLIKKIAV